MTQPAPEVPAQPGPAPQQPGPAPGPDLGDLLAEPRHRVSPRAKGWWAARALLSTVVPLVAVGIWARVDGEHRGLQVGLAVALGLLMLARVTVEPWWRYTVHRWDVTDEAVFTRSGWVTQHRRVAPISRIQTVDVERGPLAGLFGLATLTVTTASAQGPVDIEGLEQATAEMLVRRLTVLTAHSPDDAT